MVQIKIGVTEQIEVQLRQEAKDRGLSISEIVRQKITESYEARDMPITKADWLKIRQKMIEGKRQRRNDNEQTI